MTDDDFESLVVACVPRLRRALLGAVGAERVDDAVAEALAWAYSHQIEVGNMVNPIGYLYRVGQSKSRSRVPVRVFRQEPDHIPDVEPGLLPALMSLTAMQRTAIWLAHGCGWTHAEIGEVLDISASTVATHVARGMQRLRLELGVVDAHH